MRDSVLFYRSFWEAIKELPAEQFKISVQAIMEYGLNDRVPETTGIERTIYLLVKPQIDANNRRYQNGTKGGRPKSEPEPSNNQKITKNKPDDNQAITKGEPKEKEKDKVKENVKVKDKNYPVRFEQMWDAYPRKKEKAAAYKSYQARLNDGFSEDELETAVKRYAESCRLLETEERYIKHAATFFGTNTPFLDFLKADYKPPQVAGKKKDSNRFHNLEEHGYDYDKIVWEMMNHGDAGENQTND